MTPAELMAAGVLAVFILVAGSRRVRHSGAGAVAFLGAVALVAVEIAKHQQPAAARPVVVTRTVVEHTTASHPVLSGWPLVVVIGVALVVALVIMLNIRSGE
jgi:hypothetical protein